MRDKNIKDPEVVMEDVQDAIVEDETVQAQGGRMVFARDFFSTKVPLIESLSFIIFLATILLVVIGFVPAFSLPAEIFKKGIFMGGVILSFMLWLLTRLEDGRFIFPGGLTFWSSLGVIASTAISAILAPSVVYSIFGVGYEQDTLISIVVFFVALFLASTYFESRKRLFYFYVSLLLALIIVALVEFVQLFTSGSFLSGGIIRNLVGKWYDLGILFGLGTIISLSSLELFEQSRLLKRFFSVLLVVSLLLVALVNYDFVWLVVGIFSLIIYIYRLAFGGILGRGFDFYTYVKPSLFVLILSAVLFFSGDSVGDVLRTKYNIYPFEIRPSWQSTVDITRKVIDRSPWFGSGPNTFPLVWAALKPEGVNNTAFWATDFNVGYGRVVSSGVTLGVVGLISWLAFVFSLLYLGLKTVFSRAEDPLSRSIVFTSVLTTLYLWVFSLFYVTDTAVLVLTFVATGALMAVLAKEGYIKNYEFSFLKDPRLGFVSVLMVVVFLIVSISTGYLLSRKYLALYNYGLGINFSQNIAEAEASLVKAIKYDEQDLYYRTLSNIEVTKLLALLGSKDVPQDKQKELVEQVKITLSQASGTARRAVDIDKSNYANWMALGRVGEVVVPIKAITDAYKLASDSYSTALKLNPNNPAIDLAFARLEVANNNLPKAKDHINSAIKKKGNFTEAYFLLSQIYSSEGNLAEGISKAEQAALFSPNDAGVQFQLGFLKYMNKDYAGAVDTLKKATAVQDKYSNAKFFLGLSYSKLGNVTEAIKEFSDISSLNPDNEEVKNILTNLRAGRGALDGFSQSEREPEKRSKLPVKED